MVVHNKLLVVMGVSGSGKSTLCAALQRKLAAHSQMDVAFFEGDDFHSPANKAKMERGQALNEQDRAVWLRDLSQRLSRFVDSPHPRPTVGLVACSALKQQHRDVFRRLRRDNNTVTFVHLQGAPALIGARLDARAQAGKHFMPASLLGTQLTTLEDPGGEADVVTLSLSQPDGAVLSPEALAEQVYGIIMPNP